MIRRDDDTKDIDIMTVIDSSQVDISEVLKRI